MQNTSTISRFPTTSDTAEKTVCHQESVLLSTAAKRSKINSVLHVSAVSSGHLGCCSRPIAVSLLWLLFLFRLRSVHPRDQVLDQQQLLTHLHIQNWPHSTTFPVTPFPICLHSDAHNEAPARSCTWILNARIERVKEEELKERLKVVLNEVLGLPPTGYR